LNYLTRRCALAAGVACLMATPFSLLGETRAATAGGSPPVSVIAAMRTFSLRNGIALSPDGRWASYTLNARQRSLAESSRFPNRAFGPTGMSFGEGSDGKTLQVVEVRSGRAVTPIDGSANSWGGAWSHDGSRLAFYSDKGGSAGLWLWDTRALKAHRLSPVVTHTYFGQELPAWLADDKSILVKVLPEGTNLEAMLSEARALTPLPDQTVAIKADPRTGATVNVLAYDPASAQPGPARSAGSDTPAWEKVRYGSDLALVRVRDGHVDRIIRGALPAFYRVSPKGTAIAYAAAHGMTAQQAVKCDVSVYDLAARKNTSLGITTLGYCQTFSWSPDGSAVASIGQSPSGAPELVVTNVASPSAKRVVISPKDPTLGTVTNDLPPLWTYDGRSVIVASSGDRSVTVGALKSWWRVPVGGGAAEMYAPIPNHRIIQPIPDCSGNLAWSPDEGQSIVFAAQNLDSKDGAFYNVRVDGGFVHKLLEQPQVFSGFTYHAIASCNSGRDQRRLLYAAQSSDHPMDLFLFDSTFDQPHRLSQINPALGKYAFGESRLIAWSMPDGHTLHGALLLPPASAAATKPYPLLVWVYGTFNGSDFVNAFDWESGPAFNPQVLATRGYAVFYPDAPISSHEPAEELMKDVIPGVDRLVSLGIADPTRLAIAGQSYGGFSTLAIITRTARFKAAIASAGLSDLFKKYGDHLSSDGTAPGASFVESGQPNIGATPWENRQRYIDNSPFFALDRVETPVMLEAGTEDGATGTAQSDPVFIGLRRLRKEVVYLRYGGEAHVPHSLPNIIDFWNRRIDFLDKHLGVTR